MRSDRLATLVLARVATSKAPASPVDIAKALRRFAPADLSEPAWLGHVERAIADAHALEHVGDREALARALGTPAKSWQQVADRLLPLLALGVALDDPKVTSRFKDRDAWTAAIAARLLGLWHEGPPPSLAAVCDAFAWRQLGLAGRPKRCPPEIRAVFFQRELATATAGPPDRVLRLYVGRELAAARSELRVLRDALVRRWLQGRDLAPTAAPSFGSQIAAITRAAREGLFGDRKVFISSVWDELRRQPSWATLSLDDFKHRLLEAHRAGELVLARADLVAAMDPELVSASETRADGASFHFIVREDAP